MMRLLRVAPNSNSPIQPAATRQVDKDTVRFRISTNVCLLANAFLAPEVRLLMQLTVLVEPANSPPVLIRKLPEE